jgi:uncharacterized protein involved in exopolysaccharide biosynthesis
MSKNVSAEDDFNSLNVLYFIFKWRKPLVIIGVASFLISGIVALTIQEKYKSSVILFPVATSSISQTLLTENNFKHGDLLQFGAEEEAEQMLQILNSDYIRTRICEKYNLMNHYGISKDDKCKRTKLYEEFQNNITFRRTEFMSVKIDVMDHNADTAAFIANDIAALHDSTKTRMQQDRAAQALKIVEREYRSKLADVNAMSDSIKVINGFGLYDYESQSEVTSEQYAIAISKGDQRAIKSLEVKLKIIGDYGSAYVALRDNIELQRKQLNLLKTKYEQAKVDVEQVLSQKFIVSNAFPAEKKSYPICWVIIAVSVLGSLLVAIISILLIENIRQIKVDL